MTVLFFIVSFISFFYLIYFDSLQLLLGLQIHFEDKVLVFLPQSGEFT